MLLHETFQRARRLLNAETAVDVEAASAVVLAANTSPEGRAYLLIQNVSDTDVWISFTPAAVGGECFFLAAGGVGSLELADAVGNGAITAIHAGVGSKRIIILEG